MNVKTEHLNDNCMSLRIQGKEEVPDYNILIRLNQNDIMSSRKSFSEDVQHNVVYIEMQNNNFGIGHETFCGMPVETAREIARHLNKMCDEIEGRRSLRF